MSKDRDENGKLHALRYAVLPTVVTWLLMALTFTLPLIDWTRPPYIDLSGSIAEIAYWIAWSGSKVGAPILALMMILAFVGLRPISAADRCKEALIIAFVATLFAGGGATLNENILKTDLKVPRPNVVSLAGENGAGPLGMTAEQFYQIDTKASRSEAMENALALISMQSSKHSEAKWNRMTGSARQKSFTSRGAAEKTSTKKTGAASPASEQSVQDALFFASQLSSCFNTPS